VERANWHVARGLHDSALLDLAVAVEQVPERWVERTTIPTLELYLNRHGEDPALAAPIVAELAMRGGERHE
jgi:hypothetical protein